MPERADYTPPLTKWDCEQPDPMEGLVCTRCRGTGVSEMHFIEGKMRPVSCPDCGGRGKP